MSGSEAVVAPSPAELHELALSEAEYRAAREQLGREPGRLELALLGALWSEHCSYKTSKRLLRQIPGAGARVLQGPGENAGVVDLGGDLVCCFKIESHNHPSAVEPVQGAATAVGGILRDVIAMGARPVALLDGIRFGELDEAVQRQRLARVVEGIGWYGNCIGVPTLGGETYFDQGYRDDCLVNAMCVGLARKEELRAAAASTPGSRVLLVGADTGRDGIHGATFASVELDEDDQAGRPAVQVGNPFLEKCLLEACQELAQDRDLIALQDCGAAGLTSSCAEMAEHGRVGIELDVLQVSRRESGMSAAEVMLSESQERMVLVVRDGSEERFRSTFGRWGLHSDVIGRVLAEPLLRVKEGERELAALPLAVLSGVPLRRPPAAPPAELDSRLGAPTLGRPPRWPVGEAWARLLSSSNCGERRWIWRQYDHQVGDDTVVGPGGDAAVLRLRGRPDGLAMSLDSAHRSASLDPRRGTAIAVAEGLRNLACVGAEPLAITDCLNFGDPDQPEVMWQLEEAVAGLAEAASELGIPVVSGNVSLYNHSRGRSIPPTPTLGMVGLVPRVELCPGPGFRAPGDLIALVGAAQGPAGPELGGSEYQRLSWGGIEGPAPELDLRAEAAAARAVREAVRQGWLRSARDLSRGGLGLALAKEAAPRRLGAILAWPLPVPQPEPQGWAQAVLFGETQGRYLVSLGEAQAAPARRLFGDQEVPFQVLGEVGGDRLLVSGVGEIALQLALGCLEGAIEAAMEGKQIPGMPVS